MSINQDIASCAVISMYMYMYMYKKVPIVHVHVVQKHSQDVIPHLSKC